MFKNVLIGILLAASAAFAYLYETENSNRENALIDLSKYKRLYEFSDSLLANRNLRLDSAYQYIEDMEYKLTESAKLNLKVQEELAKLQAGLDTISTDSIGTYLITNFAGDSYYISKVNDNEYILIQDITGRDIVSRDLDYKALKERFKLVSNDSDMKDSIIIKQAESLDIAINTGDAYKELYDSSITSLMDRDITIQDLNNELDRTKKIAWGSVIINGVLIVMIILI